MVARENFEKLSNLYYIFVAAWQGRDQNLPHDRSVRQTAPPEIILVSMPNGHTWIRGAGRALCSGSLTAPVSVLMETNPDFPINSRALILPPLDGALINPPSITIS